MALGAVSRPRTLGGVTSKDMHHCRSVAGWAALALLSSACAGSRAMVPKPARTPTDAPSPLGAKHRVLELSLWGNHPCAILEDHAVKCWGVNDSGQLGLGDVASRGDRPGQMGANLPSIDLGPGRFALDVSAGTFSTCAILDDHSLRCWGGGVLGLGPPYSRGSRPGQMGASLPPVNLGEGRSTLAVSSRSNHTCALLDNRAVKCWGENGNGQLGLGDTKARGVSPAEMGNALPQVDLGVGRSALAIATGSVQSCALLDNRTVKCWGAKMVNGVSDKDNVGDKPGQMGDLLPPVDLGPGRSALSIAAGSMHTCALLDSHHVKCWGRNGQGELGVGDKKDRGNGADDMGAHLPEVDLGPGRTAVSISAGYYHTCAVLDDHSLKCWGKNTTGELGLGDTTTRGDAPGQMGAALPSVDLGPGRFVRVVAAGGDETCAVLDDESMRCWGGSGQYEPLGLGDTLTHGNKPGQMGANLPAIKLWPDLTAAIAASEACNRSDLDACDRLGRLYADGEDAGRHFELSAALYRRACDGGNARGCRHLGAARFQGEGVPKDPELAAAAYRSGCTLGDSAACTALGYLYSRGDGVDENKALAATWLKKGCDGGDAEGCDNLAWLYDTGDGFTKDLPLALELYKKACDAGQQHACMNMRVTAAELEEAKIEATLTDKPDYSKLEVAVDAPQGQFGLGSGCGAKGLASINGKSGAFATASATELAKQLAKTGFRVVTSAAERTARAILGYTGVLTCDGHGENLAIVVSLDLNRGDTLASISTAIRLPIDRDAAVMARAAAEALFDSPRFEHAKRLMRAVGARALSDPDLCKLDAARILNSGFAINPIAAISTGPGRWRVLVDILDRTSDSKNDVLRLLSVGASPSLVTKLEDGCLDNLGHTLSDGIAVTNDEFVIDGAGTVDARSAAFRPRHGSGGGMNVVLNDRGGTTWERFDRDRDRNVPVLELYRRGEDPGAPLPLFHRYEASSVPSSVQQERVVELGLHHYVVAAGMGATLVRVGADEDECRPWNENAKAALEGAGAQDILRVAVGAGDAVYVAGITRQDQNFVLKLTPEGKLDPTFHPLTSLPFKLGDARNFLSEFNPYATDRAKVETMRELADGRLVLFGWAHPPLVLSRDGAIDRAYSDHVEAATKRFRNPAWIGYHILGLDTGGFALAVRVDPQHADLVPKRSGTLFVLRPNGTMAEDVRDY
jgi:alpha-tubulin suppressor-like RCC1 family protein